MYNIDQKTLPGDLSSSNKSDARPIENLTSGVPVQIPVYQPYLFGNEAKYVNQCLESSWISSKGNFIQRFEKEFSQYIGSPFATSTCNGTTAIHLALAALGIGPGDEVIVPTFTYIASINPILQLGATPVFVDSLPSTWQVNPAEVKNKITPRTKAIMVVHLYGQTCDMDQLTEICRKHRLLMIEDCAEAFGSRYRGQHVGTFGDVATFSFFGNKTITTGEGGMVVARSEEVMDRARNLKTQGVSPVREYWHDQLAYNYRMTNVCAAIGLAQLENANEIIDRKRRIAEWYKDELEGLPLALHTEQPDTTHSFWMCSATVHAAQDRDRLRSKLRDAGVETRPLFYPAHTMPHCRNSGKFPVADMLSAHGLNFPSYPALQRTDIQLIGETIRQYFAQPNA